MQDLLKNELKFKINSLEDLKKSYYKYIKGILGYGEYINSKDLDEQSKYIKNIAEEMNVLEIEINMMSKIISLMEKRELNNQKNIKCDF